VLGYGLTEVRGRGASIPAAFAQAALGAFALIAGRPRPGSDDKREVRAHGRTLDDLLAAWIGECLYVHEIEGWAADRVEFVAFRTAATPGGEGLRLHAFVHGGEAAADPDAVSIRMVRRASVQQHVHGVEAIVLLEAEPVRA
jgi:SHS2 domain-containing protein